MLGGFADSKHFHGITLIEDAYTLWAKLKAEQGTADWNPELDEEFEDKQGNVMNRKTCAHPLPRHARENLRRRKLAQEKLARELHRTWFPRLATDWSPSDPPL